MKILGINCMNHDAAMAVVDYSSGIGEVLWAAHAERYSKVKNDHYLNQAIVDEAAEQAASSRLQSSRWAVATPTHCRQRTR